MILIDMHPIIDRLRKGKFPSSSHDDLIINYGVPAESLDLSVISEPRSAAERGRVSDVIAAWRIARVSRWNHLREYSGRLPNPYVLVIDQPLDEDRDGEGTAGTERFSLMLDVALAENPECYVVVTTHPGTSANSQPGHFEPAMLGSMPRLFPILEDAHPVGLIEKSQAVYTVTSPIGFEALIWGKPVRTFGMPFYAGRGLTEDDLTAPSGRRRVSLVSLVHAALIEGPSYIDSETGRPCEPERLIEWMGLQRRMRERFAPHLVAYDIPRRKQQIVQDFIQGCAIEFVAAGGQVPPGRDCIVWGRKPVPPELSPSQRVIRIEDGFIRSVGLGAEFVRPLSWMMDDRGIYYDSTRPSDLENLLMNTTFEPALLRRARVLRHRIVESGLSKYNVGSGQWQRPAGVARVILVPGQVESDASIEFGAPKGVCTVHSNIDLLRTVRRDNPDAYVVYKPHPDVLAGLRKEGVDERLASRWCDEQVSDLPMNVLLACVDEVHVLTSLTGFEALLRDRNVTCYGQPFYAGWGLTEDKVPVARRARLLSLDELVAGALILYPTYVSRRTCRFTTPERAMDELLEWRAEGDCKLSLWRRFHRLYLGFYRY